MNRTTKWTAFPIFLAGTALLLGAQGCKKKETVLDIGTPAGGIEVQQDKSSGGIEIEVKENK